MQDLTLSCGVIGTATTAAILAAFSDHGWPHMHSFAIQHCAANLIESKAESEHLEKMRASLNSMHASHARAHAEQVDNGSKGIQQDDVEPATTTNSESLAVEPSSHKKEVSSFHHAAIAAASTLYGVCFCLSTSSEPRSTVTRTERLEGVHIDPYVTLRVVMNSCDVQVKKPPPFSDEHSGRVAGLPRERKGLQLLHLFGCFIGRGGGHHVHSHGAPVQQWINLIESSTSLQEVCVGQLFPEFVEGALLRGIASHAASMKNKAATILSTKRPRQQEGSCVEQHASSLSGPLLHTVCIRGTHTASGRVEASDEHLHRVLECKRLKNLTLTSWHSCSSEDAYSPAVFFNEDSLRHLSRTHDADAFEHFSAALMAFPSELAVRPQPGWSC